MMELIHLGENIIRLRRKEQMTQEKLAAYMGVSKSSVSKWETGTTYPDIILLPQLATLFNVSIDELIGYEPQLNKDRIRLLYHELAAQMAEDPKAALEKCEKYIQKYNACFPFLMQMIILLLNHSFLFENQMEIFVKLEDLCERIISKSQDAAMIKEAISIKAVLYLQENEPQKILEMLGEEATPLQQDVELIAASYQMLGDLDKASEILQVCCFQHLLFFIQDSLLYMTLHIEDKTHCEEVMHRIEKVNNLFHIRELHPYTAARFYISCASVYVKQGVKEQALWNIEQFVDCALHDDLEKLHGDAYFYQIDEWLQQLELGDKAPLSPKIIKETLIVSLEKNPLFDELHAERRFQMCIEKLKNR